MSAKSLALATALIGAIAAAETACVPLNLHESVKSLAGIAEDLAAAPAADAEAVAALSAALSAAVTALTARVDEVHGQLIAAGVIPAPAPADQPQG